MTFTDTEIGHPIARHLGRPASIGPSGAPQNHAVASFPDGPGGHARDVGPR